MTELKKVIISIGEQEYGNGYCPRCDTYCCRECVDFHTVDFDIEEDIYEGQGFRPPEMRGWKGEQVCPWCYNQLVDIKNKGVL